MFISVASHNSCYSVWDVEHCMMGIAAMKQVHKKVLCMSTANVCLSGLCDDSVPHQCLMFASMVQQAYMDI